MLVGQPGSYLQDSSYVVPSGCLHRHCSMEQVSYVLVLEGGQVLPMGIGAASLLQECDGNRGGRLFSLELKTTPLASRLPAIRVIPVSLGGFCLLSIFSLPLVLCYWSVVARFVFCRGFSR